MGGNRTELKIGVNAPHRSPDPDTLHLRILCGNSSDHLNRHSTPLARALIATQPAAFDDDVDTSHAIISTEFFSLMNCLKAMAALELSAVVF